MTKAVNSSNHANFIAHHGDFYVPAETPEGQSVGVVKNLSYMTCVSGYSDSQCLYEYVDEYVKKLDEDAHPNEYFNKVKVFINGRWIGITEDPIALYKDLKQKYSGLIHVYTSITFNINEKIIRFVTIVDVLFVLFSKSKTIGLS